MRTKGPLEGYIIKRVCFAAPVFSSIDLKSTKKQELWSDP
jgi:hypothetical protein